MSFFTSLMYCGPAERPVVRPAELATFVARFQKLKVSEPTPGMTLQLASSFGNEPKPDNKSSASLISFAEDTFPVCWDVEEQIDSFEALIRRIENFAGPIRRAYISLGSALDSLIDACMIEPADGNEAGFAPDTWAFQLGPSEACSLQSEAPHVVEGMIVAFSGNGYLYPSTLLGLRQRLESNPQIADVMKLCQETWPIEKVVPTRSQQKVRKKMGDLWPYKDLARPTDWFWTMAETG